MDNHDVLSPALQKYYSALNSLNSFGLSGNLFDDVSRLDSFFSEFRNITFVIQKGLKTEKNKKIYEKLRDNFLKGDTLKWFVDTRNTTTKQKPFSLKKELIIDVYLPHSTVRLKTINLVVDFDKSFDEALNEIKNTFIEKLKLVEIFFSMRICFTEDGTSVDLYPKIKDGLIQMNEFIKEINNNFSCGCDNCLALSQLIEPLYRVVLLKEISFVWDYVYELYKGLITPESRLELFASDGSSDYKALADIRAPLEDFLFGKDIGNIFDVFIQFIIFHIICFREQDHTIMPVFMVIFKDNTFQMMPFEPKVKSTFYRMINEIVTKIDFSEVAAVFYCGECYFYANEQAAEIFQRPYSERREMASHEILSFTMLLNGGGEWSVFFDESKLDDEEYFMEELKNIQQIDQSEQPNFDWLAPIKTKLNLSSVKEK